MIYFVSINEVPGGREIDLMGSPQLEGYLLINAVTRYCFRNGKPFEGTAF